MRATIEGLTHEALSPVTPDERTVQAASTLVDFSVFKSFMERDIPKEQAKEIMNEVLLCWIKELRDRDR
jgi:hypothetical protein